MTQHGDAHLFSSTWYVSWIIAPRCPAFWPPGGKKIPFAPPCCLLSRRDVALLFVEKQGCQLYIHRLFSHSAPTSRFSRSTRLTRDNCLCKLNQLEIFFFPPPIQVADWLARPLRRKKKKRWGIQLEEMTRISSDKTQPRDRFTFRLSSNFPPMYRNGIPLGDPQYFSILRRSVV